MSNWTAKDRLIDTCSSAMMEACSDSIDLNKVQDDFEVDFSFLDDYLKDFAEELECLVREDIKTQINSIL